MVATTPGPTTLAFIPTSLARSRSARPTTPVGHTESELNEVCVTAPPGKHKGMPKEIGPPRANFPSNKKKSLSCVCNSDAELTKANDKTGNFTSTGSAPARKSKDIHKVTPETDL